VSTTPFDSFNADIVALLSLVSEPLLSKTQAARTNKHKGGVTELGAESLPTSTWTCS
jgi:hypothetical protein